VDLVERNFRADAPNELWLTDITEHPTREANGTQSVHHVGPSATTSGASGCWARMGTVGDCYHNAPMESFWGSMQIELLNRPSWRTVAELSAAMAEWMEDFYNPVRRHSAHEYLTTNEYEALHSSETQAAFS
jgi:putative transposase